MLIQVLIYCFIISFTSLHQAKCEEFEFEFDDFAELQNYSDLTETVINLRQKLKNQIRLSNMEFNDLRAKNTELKVELGTCNKQLTESSRTGRSYHMDGNLGTDFFEISKANLKLHQMLLKNQNESTELVKENVACTIKLDHLSATLREQTKLSLTLQEDKKQLQTTIEKLQSNNELLSTTIKNLQNEIKESSGKINKILEKKEACNSEVTKHMVDFKTKILSLEPIIKKIDSNVLKMDLQKESKQIMSSIKNSELKIMDFVHCTAKSDLPAVRIGANNYHFSNIKLKWPEAATYCRDHNMTLLSIETKEEQQALIDYMSVTPRVHNRWTWTSGSDETTEGTWIWTSVNANITFFNWAEDVYSRNNQYNCLDILSFGGKQLWNDTPCYVLHFFICEVSCDKIQ